MGSVHARSRGPTPMPHEARSAAVDSTSRFCRHTALPRQKNAMMTSMKVSDMRKKSTTSINDAITTKATTEEVPISTDCSVAYASLGCARIACAALRLSVSKLAKAAPAATTAVASAASTNADASMRGTWTRARRTPNEPASSSLSNACPSWALTEVTGTRTPCAAAVSLPQPQLGGPAPSARSATSTARAPAACASAALWTKEHPPRATRTTLPA
mmetsp:Transcript_4416/g.17721  ORF Transcript_4416/g.17721 Transcript_4416/m.17721 type:complete len:216 (+) Transcript_4416:823-1470(+)